MKCDLVLQPGEIRLASHFNKFSWSFGVKTWRNVICNDQNGICFEKNSAENPSIVKRV